MIPGVADVVIRAQGWLYEVDDEFLRERENAELLASVYCPIMKES